MKQPVRRVVISAATIALGACDGSGDKGGITEPPPSASSPATIASLEIDYRSATMAKMQDLSLTVVAKDSAGGVLTGRAISWATSDPAIVTVENGTLVGRQRGSATITASAEGKSVSSTVTVVVLTSVAAGFEESCAISEGGKLYCAGERHGPRARLVSPELRFKAVFTGLGYACAIATDDRLYCWGDNTEGQLGVGDHVRRDAPTAVVGGLKFKSVALGRFPGHTCGVTTAGDAYCWGQGREGQLGSGAFFVSSATPVLVSGGMKFTQVAAGRAYSCGLTENGRAYCWGDGEAGHLGRGPSADSPVPVPVSGDHVFKTITGAGATCALTPDGKAYCWGDNTLFKLGMSTTELCFGDKPCSTTPKTVETNLHFATISSSTFSTCALSESTVYCWGMNVDGKFGASIPPGCPIRNAPAPCTKTPTAGPTGFVTLSTARNTTCGMHSNGGAYCWGGNDNGQLGRAGVAMSERPLPFSLDPSTQP